MDSQATMYFFWLGYLVLASTNIVFSREDIRVKCGHDSLTVTWKVNGTLVKAPYKLALGGCFPSKFSPTADGGREAIFHYTFSECLFRKNETADELIYESEMILMPLTKSSSAHFIHPIKCVSKRRPPEQAPVSGILEGEGELTFEMSILNDDLSGPALSNTFPLGSVINIWASVVQQAHQPLILYLDECVASNTMVLGQQSWIYPIITNKGCLVDGKTGSSKFLQRNQSSSLVLQLQTFRFEAEQVYIHCKLVVWDPEDLNEENKACNYNSSLGEWELLDDPFLNEICHCCDYDCNLQTMQSSQSEPKIAAQASSVLGPLLLMSPMSEEENDLNQT